MEKWGFGYEALSAINPRLIYAALSGFGQSGPYAQRTSYDIIAQAMGGLMALTGFPDGPPTRGGGALGDFIGGVFTALGGAVRAALPRPHRQGADGRRVQHGRHLQHARQLADASTA